MQIIAIALGGAAGALMRFWLAGFVYAGLGKGFPWGTLVVNVLGSLLMGVAAALVVEKVLISPELKNAILVGFIGAFTTFSTFSLETLELLSQGQSLRALINVLASVVLCLGATWAGMVLTRQF